MVGIAIMAASLDLRTYTYVVTALVLLYMLHVIDINTVRSTSSANNH